MFTRSAIMAASVVLAGAWHSFAQEASSPKYLEPPPQVSYPLTEDSLVPNDKLRGRLEGPFLFQSNIIKDTIRKYWVYVPAEYDQATPAAVLVFQDGARATNPNGVLRVQNVLDNLIAKKQIPVTIGIFITPGQRGTEFPDSIGTNNPDNRDREYDVMDDTYARFIIDEMLPEVGKKYKLSDDPAARAIGGSSSGAICAFTVAWHRPDQFRNVISMIGSFTNIHGGHVYPQLVEEAEKKPIRIFLQDGINDLRSPNDLDRDWYLQNQKMKAAFEKKGYDMAFVLGDGGHSDDHGGAMLPNMLRWIWRDYPGVQASGQDEVAAAAALKPEARNPFPDFDSAATVDPVGIWKWSRNMGRRASDYSLAVQKSGESYTATLEMKPTDGDAVQTPVTDISMNGNKLSFNTESVFRDNRMPASYHGIISGNQLRGWSITSFNGNQRDNRWEASRETSQANVIGDWTVKIEAQDGNTYESTFSLAQDGDNYKGTYTSQLFGTAEARNIVVTDNKVSFEVTFNANGNDMTINYVLEADGDKATGSASSERDGQQNSMDFTAERK